MEELKGFKVILLGIVFDTKTRKILIGKREKNHDISGLIWAFPGGKANTEEDIDATLKKKIKLKTGLEVTNLGSVFSKIYPEKKDLLAIYFLCEKTGGKEEAADDIAELKWVSPEELENHFTTSFHPNLKEYIMNLK